ncbi:MAG: hypothetical protein PUC82_00060 [bacterium]|nr:hypothetical protein [bacterium]
MLPNIKLTKTEYQRLKQSSPFAFGSEGAIYQSPTNTIYKIFFDQNGMCDNKLKKITQLYQRPLEHMVKPLSTISCDDLLLGYEMTYDTTMHNFSPFYLSREDLIHVLETTREQIIYFHHYDITFGDIFPRNILINPKTKTTIFCDIDNIRLGQYPIDLMSKPLAQYCKTCFLDEKTDAYMHSLMTLNSFDLDEKFCDIEEFTYNFQKEGIEVLEGLKNPPVYNGKYLIKYIKKR